MTRSVGHVDRLGVPLDRPTCGYDVGQAIARTIPPLDPGMVVRLVAWSGRVIMSAREYDPEHPWLRQPCDQDLDWHWFQEWLALAPGTRTLSSLVRRDGCPWTRAQIEGLAHENGWKLRAEAWDAHLVRIRLRAFEEEVEADARTLAREQMAAARDVRRMGHDEVRRLRRIATKQDEYPGTIRPDLAVRAVVDGIKAERMAMGQVLDNPSADEGAGLEALSTDELRTLRQLQAKVDAAKSNAA